MAPFITGDLMKDYTQPPKALGPAKTPEELRTLMQLNNVKRGQRFHYFDFTHVPRQGWFCWFELSAEKEIRDGDQ